MPLSYTAGPPVSAFDVGSQHTSSTDSLAHSSDRRSYSSSSSSPATSVEPSLEGGSRPGSWKVATDAEKKIRLPRIDVPGEIDPRLPGPPSRTMFANDRLNASPAPMHSRPGETMPPSVTGVFPSTQWDRAGAYLSPHLGTREYSRRSSTASEAAPHGFDASRGYPAAPSALGYDMGGQSNGASPTSRKGSKEGGSGAITIGGKKRYPCQHPGCDKTFSTSGHAARHNRIHTGQKPYRCTFPGCKARFSRQDNSLQHYRTHILHPKGRSSQSAQAREAAGQLELDGMEVEGLDAEAEAKAELGRRALEDGTAIAVVYEVKDQHGRKKGETIERMVGMPRGRRDSLRSGMVEDEGSASPTSPGSARVERQNSLPGFAHAEPSHYDGASDFWSSNVARHHRLSLPQPAHAYGGALRDPNHITVAREAGYIPSWPSTGSVFTDPRSDPQSLRTLATAPPRRESIDPTSRVLPGLPDSDMRLDPAKMRAPSLGMPQPFGRGADRSGAGPSPVTRYEADPADPHRRSLSMGTGYDRSGSALPTAGPGAVYPISAPVSHQPSARSSQSPKSSPTSSAYSAPDATGSRPLSMLDKLGSGNGSASSLPSALSSLAARSRLMNGPAASTGAGYQHPYSSDRSTNLDSSQSGDTSPTSIPSGNLTLPLLSSGRSLTGIGKAGERDVASIEADRKAVAPLNSALRSGFVQDKITLPPLKSSTSPARRW